MTSEVVRDKALVFNLKGLSRTTHKEILDGLKVTTAEDSIEAIQLTSEACFLTFTSKEAKQKVLIQGFDLKERRVRPQDIDKTITNVTLKDLPVEIPDQFVSASMAKYGSVINGTITRGYIRGTHIQNGNRYFQMLDVKDPIPNLTNFGKYHVRIFCDNQKTQCKYCSLCTHPYYNCPQKPQRIKKCYNCESDQHLIRDCPLIPCNFCGLTGHKISECSAYQSQLDNEKYGEYAAEIKEGRRFLFENDNTVQYMGLPKDQSTPQTKTETVNPSQLPSSKDSKQTKEYTKVIFGASNLCSAAAEDDDTIVIAKSGATAQCIEELFDVFNKTPGCASENIDIVVMHLGTNDIKKTKLDADKVKLNISDAMTKIREKFPNLIQVGISAIPPKRAKGPQADKFNETVSSVNDFSKKFSERNPDVIFISNEHLFRKSKDFSPKVYYNTEDAQGIHLNAKGVEELLKTYRDVLHPPEEFLSILREAKAVKESRKRHRSDLSATPNSAEKQEIKRQDKNSSPTRVSQSFA